MNCTIHTEKEAVGTCTYCGKLFCQDCLVDINGRNYCREHVGKAVNEQAAASSSAQQPNIVINNTSSNVNSNTNTNGAFGVAISPKSRTISAVLCFFLGVFGIHRFYVGKIGTGILYFLTLGIFGFGTLFDFIMILLGSFRDSYGMQIKNW